MVGTGTLSPQASTPDEARRSALSAVETARGSSDRSACIPALNLLAQLERDLGNHKVATAGYMEIADTCQGEGELLKSAHALRHIGDIHRDKGCFELAGSFYDEALRIYRADQHTRPLDLTNAIRGFALLKNHTNELEQAKSLWTEAKALYESNSVTAGIDECDLWLTRLGRNGSA